MVGFEEVRPEPQRFWVRWAPRRWSGPDAPFLDLARGRLAGDALRREPATTEIPAAPADVLYLPPIAAGGSVEGWVARAGKAGHATLVQLLPGEKPPLDGSTAVVDLTSALLEGALDRLASVAPGAAAVWPLIGGLTDGADLLRQGCARLRDAGATAVQGLVPELSPVERRELSEKGGEEVYQALFHRSPPTPLRLARIAVAHGLWPWIERPQPRQSGRRRRNRALAAHLAVLAEWRLLLGHAEGAAQALFRAARWVDEEPRDVAAIAAEGNLGVVDWLDPGARREIERYAREGAGAAFGELTRELLARG